MPNDLQRQMDELTAANLHTEALILKAEAVPEGKAAYELSVLRAIKVCHEDRGHILLSEILMRNAIAAGLKKFDEMLGLTPAPPA